MEEKKYRLSHDSMSSMLLHSTINLITWFSEKYGGLKPTAE